MQKREKEVKSKGVFVGTAHFEEFDSVEEAVSYLGEDTVLSLINTQHGTNARNRVRAGVAGNLTKSALKDAAMAIIEKVEEAADTSEGEDDE